MAAQPLTREYSYRPPWRIIILGALFFGACAWVLGYAALSNTSGVTLFRVIRLDKTAASAVYWLLCVCSLGFVLMSGLTAFHRMTKHQRVVLRETELVMPKSRWSDTEVRVPYVEIINLTSTKVHGQRFLRITTKQGQRVNILSSMLPNAKDFDAISAQIAERVAQN